MIARLFNKKLLLEPVSNMFGFDRGKPIDRYYIETFLNKNKAKIKGDVLEIAESTYTKMFGGSNVAKSLILHATPDNKDANIIGDLAIGEGITENAADCFILTQTLCCIYDIRAAARNCIKLLKPGGYLLVTVPGITQISRYDMDRWGQYWSFTDLSLKMLFEEVVDKKYIDVSTYGNVKTAAAFLYGYAEHEFSKKDLDYNDKNYQLIVTAIIQKPEN